MILFGHGVFWPTMATQATVSIPLGDAPKPCIIWHVHATGAVLWSIRSFYDCVFLDQNLCLGLFREEVSNAALRTIYFQFSLAACQGDIVRSLPSKRTQSSNSINKSFRILLCHRFMCPGLNGGSIMLRSKANVCSGSIRSSSAKVCGR